MLLSYYPVQISPALNLPMGLVYLVLPITGLLFCFYAVVECLTLQGLYPGSNRLESVVVNNEKEKNEEIR